jgi:two-component system cell cycle sensor histidine kinase/response regulator CckA
MHTEQANPYLASEDSYFWPRLPQVERRQWWLCASATLVTLLLAAGMASFSLFFGPTANHFLLKLHQYAPGLVAIVFLFDAYVIYRQLRIQQVRRQKSDREEVFRLIAENAEDLITVIDKNGNRLYNSPGHKKALGYVHSELQGSPVIEQIHSDDHAMILEARKKAFTTGSSVRIEYRFRRKDGEWRILESTGTPVFGSEGKAEKLIIVSRDITERKQTEERLREREEQLRQAQKMEAVGRLSGGIAHDFNNLLGVIIGYSDEIESRLPHGDPLRKSAEQIQKAAQRAAALTHQLLAFSRQQVLLPKALDMNVLVSDMGNMLRRMIGSHIELTTRLGSNLGCVKCDQSQFEQVLVNLVVNARDAMPDGGKLSIETAEVLLDEAQARNLPFLQPGPHVQLIVSDTGIGMDMETQAHIFEPFFTTKQRGKGTGLGLATVYGVVKQSGGIVGVQSEPGKGSTFTIYLPQVEAEPEVPAPDLAMNGFSTGTETILVVEDEETLLELTSDFLKKSGYRVLTARDGMTAVQIARSFEGPIHLLLTDVMMPKLNGPALARHITDLRPETQILFMTGHTEPDGSLHGSVPKDSEFLQKPFHRDTLIRKVRHTLDLAGQQVPA